MTFLFGLCLFLPSILPDRTHTSQLAQTPNLDTASCFNPPVRGMQTSAAPLPVAMKMFTSRLGMQWIERSSEGHVMNCRHVIR